MPSLLDLVRPDGELYRLEDGDLLASAQYLRSQPSSGVPVHEIASRSDEVLLFRERLKHLDQLVTHNRRLRGADDPVPGPIRSRSDRSWVHVCWPAPATMLEIANESAALAKVLHRHVPCIEDEVYDQFRLRRGSNAWQLVTNRLGVLDYLFHGRTVADYDRDRNRFRGASNFIGRWIVATPGAYERSDLVDEIGLGRHATIAASNLWAWPLEFSWCFDEIWLIYQLLKQRFQHLPAYEINHWTKATQSLREDVVQSQKFAPLAEEFVTRWFSPRMCRVECRPPIQWQEFVESPEYIRQNERYVQVNRHADPPLISRTWIRELWRSARALRKEILRTHGDNEQGGLSPPAVLPEVVRPPVVVTVPLAAKPKGKRYSLARQAYQHGLSRLAEGTDRTITNQEVYEWLKVHGYEDYKLPQFATWERYLRGTVDTPGSGKNSPRGGRNSRSVCTADNL